MEPTVRPVQASVPVPASVPVQARPGSPEAAAAGDFRQRADELLAQLTTDEKIALLHQRSPGVPRLGIAPFRSGSEALHGVAWRGTATVFPQAVGLGASWDPELVTAVGEAAARELRVMHDRDPAVSLNAWAPVVNLLRDPRWGRNEEGYSEDPLLTARLATAYCAGLRGDHPVYWRTAPTLKHFYAYNNENSRDVTSSVIRPRVLHEYDLLPFADPVQAGVASGIMPSYNLVNGRPAHVSPLINDLVRPWAPHELVVVSDAWAPSNLVDSEHYFADHPAGHAAALRAGVDSFTDHDGDSSFTTGRIGEALRRELITVADIDRAVRRLLILRLRLGEFDPAGDPYAGAPAPDPAQHAALARRAATAAIVLLKNDDAAMPLQLEPGSRIAVVGPFADTLREDWYSGTMPYQVTVAAGLRAATAAGGVSVCADDGSDRVALAAGGRDLGEFDVFDWGGGVLTLRSARTARYLTVTEDDVLEQGPERPGGWVVRERFRISPLDGPGRVVALQSVTTGLYLSQVEDDGTLVMRAADTDAAAPVSWQLVRDGTAAAASLAASCGTCVVVVGNEPMINGRETEDRATLELPPAADRLIRAVHAANPRMVLVVMSSYPYAIGWADEHVPAIVWTCHGGQEAGNALADVLLGATEPGGRLTQTWYRDDADLPDLLDYDIIRSGRTYQYFTGRPLYPFGHGLTYTTFGYSGLRIDPGTVTAAAAVGPGAAVRVTVEVTNTGTTAGTEVVQCYARALTPRRPSPRRLGGFTRVFLRPGESRPVSLDVPLSALAHWDVGAHQLVVDPGEYEIMAGSSSARTDARAVLTVTGPPPGPRPVLGSTLDAADFDDYDAITLADASKVSGDVVCPAGDGPGWIAFTDTNVAAADGPLRATFRVAREEPGTALAVLRAGDPFTGPVLGQVTVPSTGDRYCYTELTAGLSATGAADAAGTGAADGAGQSGPWTRQSGPGTGRSGDLYVVLTGSQRLASLRIDSR